MRSGYFEWAQAISAHYGDPHGTVADQRRHVAAQREGFAFLVEFRESMPVGRDSVTAAEGFFRLFSVKHQRQGFIASCAGQGKKRFVHHGRVENRRTLRRHTVAAVSGDHRSHPLFQIGFHSRIRQYGKIDMGMGIDESRGNRQPGRIDDPGGAFFHGRLRFADKDDFFPGNTDIRRKSRCAAAVADASVSNQKIKHQAPPYRAVMVTMTMRTQTRASPMTMPVAALSSFSAKA